MPVIAIAPCSKLPDYEESVRRAGGEVRELNRATDSPADPIVHACGTGRFVPYLRNRAIGSETVRAEAGAAGRLRLRAETEISVHRFELRQTVVAEFAADLRPHWCTVEALVNTRRFSLTIDRLLGSVEIPLATIQSAEILEAGRLAGSLRTLGSGGLFGYYGRFRNQVLGRYRMYATRGDGYVLIRASQSFVLTPDSPGRFIEAIDRGRAAAILP